MRVCVFAIVFAIAIAGLALAPSTAADEPCPPGTYTIYNGQGESVSCEEQIGAPPSPPDGVNASQVCPDGGEPGYLASGELAGCFEHGMFSWEEVCSPDEADSDSDGLGDACDPCPNDPDCDGDEWGDGVEVYIGTDPVDGCPDNPSDDAWPPDINMDTWANSTDILMFPANVNMPAQQGVEPSYQARYDLNADGWVNSGDILLIPATVAMPSQCSHEVGAGALAGAAVTGWPGPNPPYYAKTVHQHSTHRWCWWFFGKHCQDKWWVHLDHTFYWCEFPVVALGSYSYEAGANWPYHVGEPWYLAIHYSEWHKRAYAGVTVYVLPELSMFSFMPETWIDFYDGGNYSTGDSGF